MFPIISLVDDDPDSHEPLGTKEKYWLRIDDQLHLFKIGRPGTGENWSEKIVAELAELLGLPHAKYDLAMWRGQKGVLSPDIVPKGGELILGNESLAAIYPNYPKHKMRGVQDHTLGRIHTLLTTQSITLPPDWHPPGDSIVTTYDLFLGYLLLDAWIANQDRHHENWGVIQRNSQRYLAPTFDHAASLGQNETDAIRQKRLTTKDRRRHISTYVERARSAVYETKTDNKPLLTLV
ncbi:MAG: phosphatidylinositol kinase, partial [Gammaproteobacteria bacterium]|nr:phosphatidylinositol kinase [Gammaproteobacteria bacterium]NNJ85169.1 phosphatidylinositol kinase [Gammaproteobacteria bacterium]